MHKLSSWLVLLALAAAAVAAVVISRRTVLPKSGPRPQVEVTKRAIPTAPVLAPLRPNVRGHRLRQRLVPMYSSDELTVLRAVSPGRRALEIHVTERDAAGGVLDERAYEYSTSYEIKQPVSRSAIDLYVSGVPRTGGFVVERWRLPEVVGSLSSDIELREESPVGVSIPFGPGSLSELYVVGGSLIPGPDRTPRGPPTRELVAADTQTSCDALGVDPQGRFFLVITGGGELRQYATVPGDGTYEVIADASLDPSLHHPSGVIRPGEHPSYGRVWVAYWFEAKNPDGTPVPASDYGMLVLLDSDNDGVMEVATSLHQDDPILEDVLTESVWQF